MPAEKEPIEAYIGMDEIDTTERILNNMSDPLRAEEREWKKKENNRVASVVSRHSL